MHVPKKRPRVARPARPPKRSLFDVDDDADQPEPDVVVDGDGDGGDESDGDVDGDNDGDSDSSSAPSSSSSSSTSSTASTASAEPEPPSVQPAPVPAAVPAAAVAENPGLDSGAKSTSWKGFKITSKNNDSGVVVGWEATCYNNDHKLPGNHCRRTRNFVPGENLICQRKLMWWCLHCRVATRSNHMKDVPELPEGALRRFHLSSSWTQSLFIFPRQV